MLANFSLSLSLALVLCLLDVDTERELDSEVGLEGEEAQPLCFACSLHAPTNVLPHVRHIRCLLSLPRASCCPVPVPPFCAVLAAGVDACLGAEVTLLPIATSIRNRFF